MAKKTQLEIIITPNASMKQYWSDLWEYRELFVFMAWRDILVRYKQTVIGIAWSVIRPLLTMLVFTFVFGQLAQLPSNGAPYPIFIFAAMLPWQFFANALSESSFSLLNNANIISKIYFPRLIIPTSAIIVALIDFALSFVIFLCMMIYYKFVPTWQIVLLPLFLLLALFASMGAGLLLAALNVKYRDFRYIVPFIVQFGLYISPVGFSSEIVPEKWRLLYSLNPMVGVIDGFRWSIIGGSLKFYWPGFIISLIILFFMLLLGVYYFRKTEQTFADMI